MKENLDAASLNSEFYSAAADYTVKFNKLRAELTKKTAELCKSLKGKYIYLFSYAYGHILEAAPRFINSDVCMGIKIKYKQYYTSSGKIEQLDTGVHSSTFSVYKLDDIAVIKVFDTIEEAILYYELQN